MKIKIIGSGSIWNEFNSACYLIDNKILIDMPNGACKYLYRLGIEPSQIDNILITHFHGDHYFDLPFYLMKKIILDKQKVNIYCIEEGKEKIENLVKLAFFNSFKTICFNSLLNYNFDKQFKIKDYKIYKIPVLHGLIKAYGYLIKKNNKLIGFTGDASLGKSIEYMASICQYLFCDCSFIKGNNKHMGIDNLIYLANNYSKCIFIASHLDNNTRNKLQELKLNNIIIASDGKEINII